ncbi:MAG: MFS transporter [Reyranella sp.]|nr:MAG: MFS transporter [Reyranella sp.]
MPTDPARSAARGSLVAVAALIGIFATTPGQTVGVSGFIDSIAADLGLSRDTVLVLYSVGTFLGILTAPTIGRQVDRFGPRRLVVPVVVGLGGACAWMSVAWNAWSLGLGFVLLRATAIAGLSLVTSQMVNLWFDRYRGRVTALAMMGLALGGLVVPPLAEVIALTDGWRAAYLSLGAGVLAIMLPVGLALYRNKPEEHGATRDFGRPRPASAGNTAEGPTLAEAARTIDFWYLAALTLLVNAVNTALLLDHVRAMGAAGLDRGAAIALLGAVTVSQAAMTLVAGLLVDRFGARPVGILGLAILAFSVVSVMTGLGGSLAYAVALGVMIATLQVAHSAGLAEAFGTAHLGSIRGTTFVIGVSGAALGPLPLVWSPIAAYSIFLTLTAAGLALGWASLWRRTA